MSTGVANTRRVMCSSRTGGVTQSSSLTVFIVTGAAGAGTRSDSVRVSMLSVSMARGSGSDTTNSCSAYTSTSVMT